MSAQLEYMEAINRDVRKTGSVQLSEAGLQKLKAAIVSEVLVSVYQSLKPTMSDVEESLLYSQEEFQNL